MNGPSSTNCARWTRYTSAKLGLVAGAVVVTTISTFTATQSPGRPPTRPETDCPTLLSKLTKLATDLGLTTLHKLGYPSKAVFQEQKLDVLRTYP